MHPKVTLHECSSFVNFSVPLPPNAEPKPAPLLSDCSFVPTDAVYSIVRSVDRFYKPQVSCRRKFTLQGVEKYFPNHDSKVRAQNSFLYKNCKNIAEHKNEIYKACEDFILGECFNIYNEAFGLNYKTGRCDTFYMLNFPNNLRFRSKRRSGTRCGSNSFPPASCNSVSFVSVTFSFVSCILHSCALFETNRMNDFFDLKT